MKHLILPSEVLARYPVDIKFDGDGIILLLEMPYWSNLHAHARDGEMMEQMAKAIMSHVHYLLIMPNTGPIDTIEKVIDYYNRLMALAAKHNLAPKLIMTLYFTDKLTPAVIEALAELPFPVAIKYYPPVKGATTGSGLGMSLFTHKAREVLNAMARCGIRLLGHFEEVYDDAGREIERVLREGYFMKHKYPILREQNPDLKINAEHASAKETVAIVKEDVSGLTSCNFTPQGLLLTYDDLRIFSWGHTAQCMPSPKCPEDRDACLEFASSGDERAHAGDDRAGHPFKSKKRPLEEAACGAWLPHALPLYVEAFRRADALDGDAFVKFMCLNGPNLWGFDLPDPNKRLRLVRDVENDMPDPILLPMANDIIVPLGWVSTYPGHPSYDQLPVGLVVEE